MSTLTDRPALAAVLDYPSESTPTNEVYAKAAADAIEAAMTHLIATWSIFCIEWEPEAAYAAFMEALAAAPSS